MADLIAQGPRNGQRWRREIPSTLSGVEPIVGRTDCDWPVEWDSSISRQHVRLVPRPDDRVEVIVQPNARNPVFHQGAKASHFTLVPGAHFVIGETTFTLVRRPGVTREPDDQDVTEQVFDPHELQQRRYRNSEDRIDVLSRLPDVIYGCATDQELLVRVTDVLLRATRNATAVAVVSLQDSIARRTETESNEEPVDAEILVLHYDNRDIDKDPPPISAKLVRSAISRRENVLHVWPAQIAAPASFTADERADWAFCIPLLSDACPGWAIYVTGQHTDRPSSTTSLETQTLQRDVADEVEDDMKFAGLVATTLSGIRQSQQLQQRQIAIRQFFAPVVMKALAERDITQVLAPREVDLAVMFCDLRGFSKFSETSDQLLELLERVSDSLGVMTRHILDCGGVIGDFHGDAAMGFWGWPFAQEDAATRAADAALRVRHDYLLRQEQSGLRCGIGIACGRGVAGQIGTVDQVKVTAFGPVVNLASRLEGLNKTFGTEIIVDAKTAQRLESANSQDSRMWRLRRLGTVRPAGMEAVTDIYELRPNTPEDRQRFSDEDIACYHHALELIAASQWGEAYDQLHRLPPSDRPKDVWLAMILRYNRTAPPGWDGVLRFPLH